MGQLQHITLTEKDVVLSSSSIKDFQSCFRKYFFKNVQLIAPRHTPSPLQIGDAFHRGVQNYYEGMNQKAVLSDIRGYYLQQQEDFDDESFIAQCEQNSMVTRAMLIGYMFRYQVDEFEDIKPEAEFCVQVYEDEDLRIWIVGKRDGLWKKDGKWWVLETKTFSDTSYERFKKKILMDLQNVMYLLATEFEIGESVHGAFYNLVRKPLIKQGESSNEAYYQRLKLDYINRSEDFYFKRLWIYRDEADKNELLDELVSMARDLKRKRAEGSWYRNTNACMQYGTCPYLSICLDKPSEDEIAVAFKTVKRFPELELQVLTKEGSDGMS